MSISSQAKCVGKKERERGGWDQAISDAKNEIKGLQFSIAVLRKRKTAGEQWPSESATHI
jgi:hypothetical protein